jgi:hypothetical protein
MTQVKETPERVCKCTFMPAMMKDKPICGEKFISNRFGDCSNRMSTGRICGHERQCHDHK